MGPRNSARRVGAMLSGIALTSLLLTASAQAGQGRHLPCPREGAEVIASDKVVRVYAYPGARLRNPTPHGASRKLRYLPQRRIEACLVRTGMRMTLFEPGQMTESRESSRGFGGVPAIAASVVAYSIDRQGPDSAGSTVFVADIAARRILRELPVSRSPYAKVSTRTAMTAFVLSPLGSAAWIDEKTKWTSFRRPDSKTFVVTAAPLGAQEAVLDESPYIGESSLTLSSGALTWWDDGVERSARLP